MNMKSDVLLLHGLTKLELLRSGVIVTAWFDKIVVVVK